RAKIANRPLRRGSKEPTATAPTQHSTLKHIAGAVVTLPKAPGPHLEAQSPFRPKNSWIGPTDESVTVAQKAPDRAGMFGSRNAQLGSETADESGPAPFSPEERANAFGPSGFGPELGGGEVTTRAEPQMRVAGARQRPGGGRY